MTRQRLLFGEQLGPLFDDGESPILLVESTAAFRRRPTHRAKAHLYLSALRHRAAELGDRAELVRAPDFATVLAGRDLEVVDPVSYRARRLVRRFGAEVLPSRGVVTREADFADWVRDRTDKSLVMDTFYRWVRDREGILMTASGRPVGGRFSYDADNRQPPPKHASTHGQPAPPPPGAGPRDAGGRRDAFDAGRAPLAGTEGFVRQIIGWRDWMWHLYWHLGEPYTTRSNALQATERLPDAFWELDADAIQANCLRHVIGAVHDRGWAHHIQRLMMLGNWALLRGYDPAETTEWFTGAFVDGTPWVMPTNVVGMSLHADGGIVATKPYAAGGAYINRMTDYCGGCRFDPKVRLGPTACPFTAGYWAFLDRAEPVVRGNPRMTRALAGLARLSDRADVVEQERHRTAW